MDITAPDLRINMCVLFNRIYVPGNFIPPEIEIVSYIANFGHRVTWILSDDVNKHKSIYYFNNIRVVVRQMSNMKIKKLLDLISYSVERLHFLQDVIINIKQEKYNIILVKNNCLDGVLDGLLAVYVSKKYKIPFVQQIENPLEQNWIHRQSEGYNSLLWHLISRIEIASMKYLIKNASLLIAVGEPIKDHLLRYGISQQKILVIPQGTDLSRFSNRCGENIRQKYGLDKSRVIIYVGTLHKIRNLDLLIQAFSRAAKTRENFMLLIVGDGIDRNNLENLAKELGMKDKVVFTGQVAQDEVPNFIAAADIGVSPVPPLEIYKASCPIKMHEYLAMGKPVVANDEIPEQAFVIKESSGGILAQYEVKSFAEAMVFLIDNPEKAKEMGTNGRKWIEQNRSYEVLSHIAEKGLLEVLSKNSLA